MILKQKERKQIQYKIAFLREEKKSISPIILTTEKYSDNANCRKDLINFK